MSGGRLPVCHEGGACSRKIRRDTRIKIKRGRGIASLWVAGIQRSSMKVLTARIYKFAVN